jgi:hypothetical protein
MGFNTAAGAILSIGNVATGSNAGSDTYTAIGQITNIPEFGRKYNEVKFSPIATRGVQKVKGSYDEGSVEIDIARDPADAGQILALIARDIDEAYNFKIAFNDAVVASSATVTITIASPGVVTDTAHGLPDKTPIKFSTTGALPTGLSPGTTYYVKLIDANTYNVAATAGGSAINTTGSQSGVQTRTTAPVSSFVTFAAQVASFTNIIGTVDSVMMRKMLLLIESGTSVETAHIP